jgi:hypothetical protein
MFQMKDIDLMTSIHYNMYQIFDELFLGKLVKFALHKVDSILY